jgi:hypothetical protein
LQGLVISVYSRVLQATLIVTFCPVNQRYQPQSHAPSAHNLPSMLLLAPERYHGGTAGYDARSPRSTPRRGWVGHPALPLLEDVDENQLQHEGCVEPPGTCGIPKSPDRPVDGGICKARRGPVRHFVGSDPLAQGLIGACEAEAVKCVGVAVPGPVHHHRPLWDACPVSLTETGAVLEDVGRKSFSPTSDCAVAMGKMPPVSIREQTLPYRYSAVLSESSVAAWGREGKRGRCLLASELLQRIDSLIKLSSNGSLSNSLTFCRRRCSSNRSGSTYSMWTHRS